MTVTGDKMTENSFKNKELSIEKHRIEIIKLAYRYLNIQDCPCCHFPKVKDFECGNCKAKKFNFLDKKVNVLNSQETFSKQIDNFDKKIIKAFEKGLLERDKKKTIEAFIKAKDRIAGKCFCGAEKDNECICGAWTGKQKE